MPFLPITTAGLKPFGAIALTTAEFSISGSFFGAESIFFLILGAQEGPE